MPVVPEFAVVDAGILRTPHPDANRYALVPITSSRTYAKKEKLVSDRKWSEVFFDQLSIHFDGWKFYEAWRDIEKHYGADRTIVTFDPQFPCGPEGGHTIGYVAFRRVLYNMVKKYTYQWKSDISEHENESKILAKIVNMK